MAVVLSKRRAYRGWKLLHRVRVDPCLVTRSADGHVIQIHRRGSALRVNGDRRPIFGQALSAMRGRRVGVLKMQGPRAGSSSVRAGLPGIWSTDSSLTTSARTAVMHMRSTEQLIAHVTAHVAVPGRRRSLLQLGAF